LNDRVEYLQSEIDRIGFNRVLEFQYLLKLKNLKVIELDDSQRKSLTELPNEAYYFYFSTSHCSSCFENELEILNKIKAENEKFEVIIITDAQSNNQLKALTDTYELSFRFFRIVDSSFEELPVEPMYFFKDEDEFLYGFFVNENFKNISRDFLCMNYNCEIIN
jgi:hypothetical protein